ncbi:MAG: hypothetical protein DRN20_05970 [Thermoplasmata archaeon]|mgnify:CR=1 FL=1|nr:MAG: hypothetical protein DRN20_05970 [Thermoplasmata archaeon]
MIDVLVGKLGALMLGSAVILTAVSIYSVMENAAIESAARAVARTLAERIEEVCCDVVGAQLKTSIAQIAEEGSIDIKILKEMRASIYSSTIVIDAKGCRVSENLIYTVSLGNPRCYEQGCAGKNMAGHSGSNNMACVVKYPNDTITIEKIDAGSGLVYVY